MSRQSEIIKEKLCACGCGKTIQVKKWHLNPSKREPTYLRGHCQKGNKRGWKTGEIKDSNGYILIYQPDHPAKNCQGKGYVKRSRLVVERFLGRYLEPDEVVHHINMVRDDDRIENLRVMSISSHLSLHHKGKHQARNSLGSFCREVSNAS
jgi:hypothetical protein